MVADPAVSPISVEDYLALEAASEIKHEYVNGCVYAMSGGTIDHDLIANNVRAVIDAHLGDGPCLVLGPDVRLRVSPTIYYYPDAIVTCTPLGGTDVEVTVPRLIVEVLSNATEANDRGDRFANYQTLATFEEYLLVNSRRRAVERFRRSDREVWLYQRYDADATVTPETIGLSCPVALLYRRTTVQ